MIYDVEKVPFLPSFILSELLNFKAYPIPLRPEKVQYFVSMDRVEIPPILNIQKLINGRTVKRGS